MDQGSDAECRAATERLLDLLAEEVVRLEILIVQQQREHERHYHAGGSVMGLFHMRKSMVETFNAWKGEIPRPPIPSIALRMPLSPVIDFAARRVRDACGLADEDVLYDETEIPYDPLNET